MSDICCGGFIYGERCEICDEIINVYRVYLECIYEESEPEEIVDENGITHYVSTNVCVECGLKRVSDSWSVKTSPCVTDGHDHIQYYKGEELVLEYTENYYGESHKYDNKYVMKGDDCEDGYYVSSYCPVCGDSREYESRGHDREYREVALEEFGLCGGYIEEEYCTIC